MYRVIYELADTTADPTSIGVTLQLTIAYTDDAGATTQPSPTLIVTTTGRVTGSFDFYLASGEISYSTAVTGGALGAARYAVRLRVMYLG
jgi:hypothetical protein